MHGEALIWTIRHSRVNQTHVFEWHMARFVVNKWHQIDSLVNVSGWSMCSKWSNHFRFTWEGICGHMEWKINMPSSPPNSFCPYAKFEHLRDVELPRSPRRCILNEGGSHENSEVELPKVGVLLGWMTFLGFSTWFLVHPATYAPHNHVGVSKWIILFNQPRWSQVACLLRR